MRIRGYQATLQVAHIMIKTPPHEVKNVVINTYSNSFTFKQYFKNFLLILGLFFQANLTFD